ALIRSDPFLRDRIEAMTPTLEVFALIQFQHNGNPILRVVHLIGVDPQGRARLGGLAEHPVREDNRRRPSFDLPPEAVRRVEEVRRLNAEIARAEEQRRKVTMPGGRVDPFLPPEIWWQFHEEEGLCVARTFGLVGGVPGGPLLTAALHPPDAVKW